MHHWLRAGTAAPLAEEPRPQNKRSDLALTQLGHGHTGLGWDGMPVSGAETTLPSTIGVRLSSETNKHKQAKRSTLKHHTNT